MNNTRWRYLALSLAIGFTSPVLVTADAFDDLDMETQSFTTPAKGSKKEVSKKSEADEFEAFRRKELGEYQEFKRKLMEEFEEYKRITQEETQKYQKQVGKTWDKPEVSSKTVWVDYSKDMKKRNKVDFENGAIEISMTVEKGQKTSEAEMRKALTELIQKDKAQAFKDDKLSQAIESRSKEKISNLQTAEVKPAPILVPYLTGKDKLNQKELDSVVDHMMKNQKVVKEKNKQGKTVVTLRVPLEATTPPTPVKATPDTKIEKTPKGSSNIPVKSTPDKKPVEQVQSHTSTTKSPSGLKQPKTMPGNRAGELPTRAKALEPQVNQYAKKADLETPLVFAIIETESAFNPMARSAVPAYGLMQVVPNSAGQDATEALFGKPKILSPSYLYNGEQNIEIGTTYLNILFYRYLKGVTNPQSRLYCTIAAYNTGAGNVAKAFTGERKLKPALAKINALTPDQVYEHLRDHLPYDETKTYLLKVTQRMDKYTL